MYLGAVLSIAPDIALFIGGGGQAAFATGLDRSGPGAQKAQRKNHNRSPNPERQE
jgi:hypothetical protein